MALVQDMTVRYQSAPQGENFTFSLSKPLNELTAEDIKSQDAFTGFNSFAINQIKEGVLSRGLPENNPNHCNMWSTVGNVSAFPTSWDTTFWSYPANAPTGVYMRTILVSRPLNKGANTSLTKAMTDVRIVLDVTPDENTNMQNLAFDNPYVTVRYNNNANGESRLTDYNFISPACIMIVNNVLYLWVYGGLAWFGNYSNGGSATIDQGYSDGYTNFDNQGTYHKLAFGWTLGLIDTAVTTGLIIDNSYPYAGNGHFENVDFNGHTAQLNLNMGASNYNKRNTITLTDNANKTITKMYAAFSGFKFRIDNVWYKPIVQGGIVTGYTDDMTVTSEWDTWSKATGHNVPSGGSSDSDIKDKEIDMPAITVSGNAGMINFIEINTETTASADEISAALSRFSIATLGKDLIRNLISYKAFAVLNVVSSTNRQISVGGNQLEDDGGNALRGSYIGSLRAIDIGTITIPTLYNDYRDYAPYTTIQMYIPFCGWFALPPWAMGKTITGKMFVDLYNGTVKAIVYASSTVIAEVGGCCAYDIPFVADATGAKAGAVISAALNTAVTGATFAAAPSLGGGVSTVAAAANLAAAVNSNDTVLKGVLGDGSNLNGLNRCFIKVTRPNAPNGSTTIPSSYKHERGTPCMKSLTLKSGDGYTQVMDANITGTMTATEKQMIIDGFRHGLIL